MEHRLPIEDATLHIFENLNLDIRTDEPTQGKRYMAHFYPYTVYPMTFFGDTEEDVEEQAQAIRQLAIDKFKKSYQNIAEGRIKAAKTRAKKKEAKGG